MAAGTKKLLSLIKIQTAAMEAARNVREEKLEKCKEQSEEKTEAEVTPRTVHKKNNQKRPQEEKINIQDKDYEKNLKLVKTGGRPA